MKVIIAGSRTVTDYRLLLKAIQESKFDITEVISGCAKGVDEMGERWAREHCLPVQRFPAEWSRYGREAGIRRNVEMAKVAEALIAVQRDKSRGTAHMIDTARKRKMLVYVLEIPSEQPDLFEP